MTLSSDSIPSRPGSDRTKTPVLLARAALFWERLWRRLWPASGIAGVALAAALAGFFEPLPWILHAFLMALAVTLTGVAVERAFRDFKSPSWEDGARRIERDSKLSDRPITEGHDQLAAGRGDGWAEALWRETLRRRLASARGLRVAWPSPRLAERDPRALRYLVLLLVVGGAIAANAQWRERLGRAFLASENVSGLAAGLDAWLDPPAYTGQAPTYLSPAMTSGITVPEGSRLNVRVHGASYAPIVTVSPSPREASGVDGKNGEYGATALLERNALVRVRAGGRTLGEWNLNVVADKPPAIAFTGKPVRTDRSALKIPFKASDDYGVTRVSAVVKPANKPGPAVSVDLALAAQSAKKVEQTAYQDFTEHPYAGLEVALVLEARDGAGHVVRTAPVKLKLPARVFTNPLARSLVEQRQTLASDSRARPVVQTALDALAIAPDLFYPQKKSVYVALRSSFHALKNARSKDDLKRVQDLLWQTALALEREGLLNAAAELRRVQQLLTQALASGAPQEVIDALLERYRQAMARYMALLAQHPEMAQQGAPQSGARTVTDEDLKALLKLIQQMAEAGNREGAAAALAMLQEMLENMRMARGGGGGGPQSPEDKKLADAIKKLGDLMGEQRGLLDKTYRQQQGMGDPKDGGPQGLGKQQGEVKKKLGEIQKGLDPKAGGGKDKLEGAGREMGNAQNQLGGNDTDSAVESEKNALEAMRQGAEGLARELMKRMGQGQDGGMDPMGRRIGSKGPDLGQGVKVPAESELQRARNILKELRRRAAERGRPQEELDYIDRLLRQF